MNLSCESFQATNKYKIYKLSDLCIYKLRKKIRKLKFLDL